MRVSKSILWSIGLSTVLAFSSLHAKNNTQSDSSNNDVVFKDFQKLQEDLNKVFENFNTKFSNTDIDDKFFNGIAFSPNTDLKELGNHYEVKVDLPGVDDTNINVAVKNNILEIDAKSQKSKEEKNDKFIKKERFIGEFHKSLTLPKDADGSKLKTDYKNGVLSISIPKK